MLEEQPRWQHKMLESRCLAVSPVVISLVSLLSKWKLFPQSVGHHGAAAREARGAWCQAPKVTAALLQPLRGEVPYLLLRLGHGVLVLLPFLTATTAGGSGRGRTERKIKK